MRKSLEQAVAVIVVLLLVTTLITSVILMFNAEAVNVKLINDLIRVGRADETIPLRVANSQLRIGMAQGLLSALLFVVTVYYAWLTRLLVYACLTRLLVKAAQPAKEAELRLKEERLRGEEVALETDRALAEMRAIRDEIHAARPRRRWF